MKKIIFSFCSIIIFSGIVFAQTSDSDSCQQFSGIVIKPSENIDRKMFIRQQESNVKASGIVVNPCRKTTIPGRRITLTRPPEFGFPSSNPFQLEKSQPKKSAIIRPRVTLLFPEATKDLLKKLSIFQ